jgi:hypothetical protein
MICSFLDRRYGMVDERITAEEMYNLPLVGRMGHRDTLPGVVSDMPLLAESGGISIRRNSGLQWLLITRSYVRDSDPSMWGRRL